MTPTLTAWLDRLQALAATATRGKRRVHTFSGRWSAPQVLNDYGGILAQMTDYRRMHDDAELLAALDPAVVEALVEVARAATHDPDARSEMLDALETLAAIVEERGRG